MLETIHLARKYENNSSIDNIITTDIKTTIIKSSITLPAKTRTLSDSTQITLTFHEYQVGYFLEQIENNLTSYMLKQTPAVNGQR